MFSTLAQAERIFFFPRAKPLQSIGGLDGVVPESCFGTDVPTDIRFLIGADPFLTTRVG